MHISMCAFVIRAVCMADQKWRMAKQKLIVLGQIVHTLFISNFILCEIYFTTLTTSILKQPLNRGQAATP